MAVNNEDKESAVILKLTVSPTCLIPHELHVKNKLNLISALIVFIIINERLEMELKTGIEPMASYLESRHSCHW